MADLIRQSIEVVESPAANAAGPNLARQSIEVVETPGANAAGPNLARQSIEVVESPGSRGAGTEVLRHSIEVVVEAIKAIRVALVVSDVNHLATTNTKTALATTGAGVVVVAQSALATFDFTQYDVIVTCRLTSNATDAARLRTLVDSGKPLLMGTLDTGHSAGTGRTINATHMGLCGTVEMVNQGDGSCNGFDVVRNTHPVTGAFALGAVVLTDIFQFWMAVDTGQSVVGAVLAHGKPSTALAGQAETWAVETGTVVAGTPTGARIVVAGVVYGATDPAYNASARTLMADALKWLTAGLRTRAPIDFGATATMAKDTPLATTSAITFGGEARLAFDVRDLAATSAITTAGSGRAIAGRTANLGGSSSFAFTTAGTTKRTRRLTATSPITLSVAGTTKRTISLRAASAVEFVSIGTQASTAAGGLLAASSAIELTATATLVLASSTALAGSSPITSTATATVDLASSAVLAGASTIALTATATPIAGTNAALGGTSTVAVNTDGVLAYTRNVGGVSDISFATTATPELEDGIVVDFGGASTITFDASATTARIRPLAGGSATLVATNGTTTRLRPAAGTSAILVTAAATAATSRLIALAGSSSLSFATTGVMAKAGMLLVSGSSTIGFTLGFVGGGGAGGYGQGAYGTSVYGGTAGSGGSLTVGPAPGPDPDPEPEPEPEPVIEHMMRAGFIVSGWRVPV